VPAAAYGLTPGEHVRRQRDPADVVVLATVLRVDTLPGQRSDPPSTGRPGAPPQANVPAPGPVVARLRVERAWRGPPNGGAPVSTGDTRRADTLSVAFHAAPHRRTSCDVALAPGAAYLVFAARGLRGLLWTRQCTGTQPAAGAGAALAALDSAALDSAALDSAARGVAADAAAPARLPRLTGPTSVRTSDTAYAVLVRPEVYAIDLPVTYTNRTRDTVWLQGCAFGLEQRVDADRGGPAPAGARDGWRLVYHPICQARSLARTPLAPGATRAWTLGVRGRRGPRERPAFTGTLPGTFRLALGVYRARHAYDTTDLRPRAERVSNAFRLTARPAPASGDMPVVDTLGTPGVPGPSDTLRRPTVHGPVLALDSLQFLGAVPSLFVRSGPPASHRGEIWVGAGASSTLLVRERGGVRRWTDWRAVGLRPGAVVSAWSTVVRHSDPPGTGADVLLVERPIADTANATSGAGASASPAPGPGGRLTLALRATPARTRPGRPVVARPRARNAAFAPGVFRLDLSSGDALVRPAGRPPAGRTDSSLLVLRPGGTYEHQWYVARADTAPGGGPARRRVTRVLTGHYAVGPAGARLTLLGPDNSRVDYAVRDGGTLLEGIASPGSAGVPQGALRGTAPGFRFRYRRQPGPPST
jgi:hypothetical protein